MPLTPQQIEEMDKLTGLSAPATTSKTGAARFAELEKLTPTKPTLASKLSERVGNVKTAISQSVEAGKDNSPQNYSSGATKMINAGASIPGQAIGAVGDVVGAGIEATGLDKPIAAVVKPIVESSPVKKLAEFYHSLPQETQDLLGNVTNIASIIPIVKGGQIAKNIANTGIKTTLNTVKTGAQAVAENPIVAGTVDIAKSAKEGIARVPDRIKTNLAEKQAAEADIKSLPSTKAQTAVRDGVDITDVRDLSKIERTPQTNKLIQTVKDYASGNRKVDPIEVVGEPLTARFKEVVKQKKEIGKQLGEASKTIGILTKPELQGGVFSRLQSVPGLEGVTLTPKGLLNFKGTTLEANIPSAIADRKAIQNAYDQAVKWGNGEKAHMYRQTLFEDLGGKKKGGVQLTGTQEKAFEAIRAGLSDVIETKSPKYKTLSNEYRKIMEPIKELQKRIKTLDPNAEDFSDSNLSAGLLTRRITSAAASNPEIRNLLKSLDSVGTTKGSTFNSAVQLQDMYNILNKYYDIAPKTGFQNLVKEGAGSSDTMLGNIKAVARDVAGNSNAVRQKALEDLLDELGVVLK